jgi:hypothetical protein
VGRYKSKSAGRQDRAKRIAYFQLAFAAIVLVGLVWAFFSVTKDRKALDPVTACPPSASSIVVLLVDVTDPLTLAQRQDFLNQLERLRDSVPRYGKLAIFQVDAASNELLRPVIERCNPGTAADVDEMTGNPAAVEEKYEALFKRPLDEAFSQLINASGADRSPILESVQSVALTELKRPGEEGKPMRLIIASDLLQNTDRISFYGHVPRPEELIGSDAFRVLRTDMSNIKVELWMLQRLDAQQSQPRALIDLWDALITEQGGTVTRAYNVSG